MGEMACLFEGRLGFPRVQSKRWALPCVLEGAEDSPISSRQDPQTHGACEVIQAEEWRGWTRISEIMVEIEILVRPRQ